MKKQIDLLSEIITKNTVHYRRKSAVMARGIIYPLIKPKLSRPIFIVGCSRSGTTAVYLTLSQSEHIASLFKESHEMWETLHPVSENGWDSHNLTAADATDSDLNSVTRFFYTQLGLKRFVDKANQNCFRIPYLQALFSDAFFLFVKRNGPDNINSLIHGWGRPAEYGKWAMDLPEKVSIDRGVYNLWSFFLFKGWRRYLEENIETVCAHQWIAANNAVLNEKQRIPRSRWVEVCYEDILSSPFETFYNVFEKLQIPFTPKIENYCSTLIQNPTNAFSKPRLHKWKEENLEKIHNILPIISDMMVRLGYNYNDYR